MVHRLVLLLGLLCARWFVKRDAAIREGVSSAIWIPTLWVGIIASRPITSWLGFGGGSSTMEGSPVDALIFVGLIIASLYVLSQRRLDWSRVVAENWPVFLFYGYLLLSITWANSTPVSFKRWFKEFGNIAVVLVLLTERNPLQAVRAVFVRCGFFLIPLSLIYVRYFPSLGRHYLRGGQMEVTGVTTQKNTLGVLILVCGLIAFWDWLRLREELKDSPRQLREATLIRGGMLALGAYLLYLCDSQTSMLCLLLGMGILLVSRVPILRGRLPLLGLLALAAVPTAWVLNELFGVTRIVVEGMGRDMTFTGRTDVWRELLGLKTDSIFGVGFMSFWDDPRYQSQLPVWVAKSAHNGYLDQYLTGGWIGILFLVVMLLGAGVRVYNRLAYDGDYGAFRFAILAITLVGNFSESNFACMTPIGFLFLLTAIGHAPRGVRAPAGHSRPGAPTRATRGAARFTPGVAAHRSRPA